jgi:hypothetical protein
VTLPLISPVAFATATGYNGKAGFLSIIKSRKLKTFAPFVTVALRASLQGCALTSVASAAVSTVGTGLSVVGSGLSAAGKAL